MPCIDFCARYWQYSIFIYDCILYTDVYTALYTDVYTPLYTGVYSAVYTAVYNDVYKRVYKAVYNAMYIFLCPILTIHYLFLIVFIHRCVRGRV